MTLRRERFKHDATCRLENVRLKQCRSRVPQRFRQQEKVTEVLDRNVIEKRPVYSGPLYVQIQRLLHERMATRVWAPGSVLPNEGDLAREFGVSVGTMRKALHELEAAGWIVRKQGRGTFVSDPNQISRRRLNNFYLKGEHFHLDGYQYEPAVLGRPDPSLQLQLGLSSGERVLAVRRKKIIRGIIRSLEDISIPERLCSGGVLGASQELKPVTDALIDSYSCFIRRCVERVRPILSGPEHLEHLGIEQGMALLRCERIAYDAEDVPLEHCRRDVCLESVDYRAEMD